MIDDDTGYHRTRQHLDQFERALANRLASPEDPPTRQNLEVDALATKAQDLRDELREYERRTAHGDHEGQAAER